MAVLGSLFVVVELGYKTVGQHLHPLAQDFEIVGL